MRIVITGGSCTGKTSLVNGILAEGYKIIPEVARDLLVERGVPRNYTDRLNLQKAIVSRQAEIESQFERDLVFQDRSLIDCMAYSIFYLGDGAIDFSKIDVRKKYSSIFLLDRLPFRNDSERHENPEQAEKIHDLITSLYLNNGYNPIRVPVLTIDDRVKFVLDRCL